jgi:hypothetical protein
LLHTRRGSFMGRASGCSGATGREQRRNCRTPRSRCERGRGPRGRHRDRRHACARSGGHSEATGGAARGTANPERTAGVRWLQRCHGRSAA